MKVEINLEKAPAHIIEKLVGIKGNTNSEVCEFILKCWMLDHVHELKNYGISVKVGP